MSQSLSSGSIAASKVYYWTYTYACSYNTAAIYAMSVTNSTSFTTALYTCTETYADIGHCNKNDSNTGSFTYVYAMALGY